MGPCGPLCRGYLHVTEAQYFCMLMGPCRALSHAKLHVAIVMLLHCKALQLQSNSKLLHCSAVQSTCIALQANALHYIARVCNGLHTTALQLHCSALHCKSLPLQLQCVAFHCNPLQGCAGHCKGLQVIETYCKSLQLKCRAMELHCLQTHAKICILLQITVTIDYNCPLRGNISPYSHQFAAIWAYIGGFQLLYLLDGPILVFVCKINPDQAIPHI